MRKPEWNRPNRKDAQKIARRISAYNDMKARPDKFGIDPKRVGGYHCPGSAS